MMAYRAVGLSIPRTTQAQWAYGRQIPASQAQPGDLVFFAGADGTPAAPGHVGIVVNPATHTMIDAYATGYPVEYDTYGLPASKEGLSPVVGFTSRFSSQMSLRKRPAQAVGGPANFVTECSRCGRGWVTSPRPPGWTVDRLRGGTGRDVYGPLAGSGS
jgi:hypothetical protein